MDTMPRLGLGTWEQTGDDATRTVDTALGLGYRHIDTAQAYGNEAEVGAGIAKAGVDRDDLWVTTKIWNDHIPDRIAASTEESLDDLGLDHVDLLLLHWPVAMEDLGRSMAELTALQERGLARHIGVSNFTAEQVAAAAAEAPILTDQCEYHLMLDQTPVREALADVDAFLTAYSPLARGSVMDEDVVSTVAGGRGMTPAQLALRWLLDQEDVAVIPKATSEAHLRANLEVLGLPPLQPEDREALARLPKDRRQIDPPFAPDWD